MAKLKFVQRFEGKREVLLESEFRLAVDMVAGVPRVGESVVLPGSARKRRVLGITRRYGKTALPRAIEVLVTPLAKAPKKK